MRLAVNSLEDFRASRRALGLLVGAHVEAQGLLLVAIPTLWPVTVAGEIALATGCAVQRVALLGLDEKVRPGRGRARTRQ